MEHSGELVPYASEARQIVLRHRNTVVVYDDQSKQLITDDLNTGELSECPYCHRPFETSMEDEDLPEDDEFIDPHYFRRLDTSRASSQHPSRPPSPPWKLVEPKKSRVSQSRDDLSAQVQVNKSKGISSKSFSQGYFKDFFVEEKELGRGGKGVVLLVRHVLDGVTLGRFACKRIPTGNDHQWLEKVLMEVTLLQEMSHENLVSYRHVWLEDYQATVFTPRTPHVFILQKYCNSGTLLDYVLHSEDAHQSPSLTANGHGRRASILGAKKLDAQRSQHLRRLHLEEILAFFKDITSGLAHLHANNYVHRDLKPQNCLLHRTGNITRVLVSDFGEMQGVSVPRSSDATGYTGTMSFTAPEVLGQNSQGAFGDFTFKSDVFSLGMIMFFMCFGRLPYVHADLDDDAREDLDSLRAEVLAWRGMEGVKKERSDLPDKLYENLQLLLSRDPGHRPSTEDILRRMRTGSSFHEHTTSPTGDRFPSPEFGFRQDRSRSPEQREHGSWQHSNTRAPPPMTRKSSSEAQVPASINRKDMKSRDRMAHVDNKAISHTGPLTPRASTMANHTQPHFPMLMPPPNAGLRQKALSHARRPEAVVSIRLALFLGKVWTLMSACSPALPIPAVLYPLLVAAAIDLTGYINDPCMSVALALAHGLVIFESDRRQILCQR